MALCIFCREDGSSLEHVIAEGIGGRKTINRLCTRCNSDFGTRVDAKLINHPLIAFERARLGIAGKSDVPQPLASGYLADDPDVPVYNVVSDDDSAPEVQLRVFRSTNAAGEDAFRVVGGTEDEVLEATNKILKRKGHEPDHARDAACTREGNEGTAVDRHGRPCEHGVLPPGPREDRVRSCVDGARRRVFRGLDR